MDDHHPSVEWQVVKPVLQTIFMVVVFATLIYAYRTEGLSDVDREQVLVPISCLVAATAALLTIMARALSSRMRCIMLEDEEVRFLAYHDSLSRLPNRALFQARLKAHLTKARWTSRPFALALLDLNGFKSVNDTHGHQCGDLVLKAIANRLQNALRSTDVVARLGGDEFGVILPSASNELALQAVLSKIIHAVEESILLPNNLKVEVGIGIGVVICGSDISSPEALMYRADLALYDAKSRGRSCFVFAPEAPDEPARKRYLAQTSVTLPKLAG